MNPIEAYMLKGLRSISQFFYGVIFRRSNIEVFSNYFSEIDRRNEENKQKYDEQIVFITNQGRRIAQKILELNAEHPYMRAKREILNRTPQFETVMSQIQGYIPKNEDTSKAKGEKDLDSQRDPLFEESARFIVGAGDTASTSSLQRRYSIGYIRAGKIMNQLEAAGIVGPALGSKPRKVLFDPMDLELLLSK